MLDAMPAESVQCCVTSPPYWQLRDYGVKGQIGREKIPEEHIAVLVQVFREVRRVLKTDGTLWVNYGDAYCSNAGGYDDTGSRGVALELGRSAVLIELNEAYAEMARCRCRVTPGLTLQGAHA